MRAGDSGPTIGMPLSNPAPGAEKITPQIVGSVLGDPTRPPGEKAFKPVPERRDFAMAGHSPAKDRVNSRSLVLEKPVIAQSPASPDVELNLKLGALAGLLVAFLIAFPLAAIAKHIPAPNAPAFAGVDPEDF